jgi:hypothetical protein
VVLALGLIQVGLHEVPRRKVPGTQREGHRVPPETGR